MSFDPGPYADYYKAKNAEELKVIHEKAAAAILEAHRLAELIMNADPNVQAVVLFGSLAEDGPRRKEFDIDLALVGGDIFKAMDVTDSSPFKVDLVRLDRLPQHMKARIARRGKVLAGTLGGVTGSENKQR